MVENDAVYFSDVRYREQISEEPLVTNVEALSQCDKCQYVVKEVALATQTLKLNEESIVIRTQTICQQLSLYNQFSLECNSYNDVQKWLMSGGLVTTSAVDYQSFADEPIHFCTSVQLCGTKTVNITDLDAITSEPVESDPLDAYICRFKLRSAFRTIPKGTETWVKFKEQFLVLVSQTTQTPIEALSLQQKAGDEFSELIFKRTAPFNQTEIKSTVSGYHSDIYLGYGNKTEPTPENRARLFKAILTPGNNAKNIPGDLLAQVDFTVTPKVMPMVVPPIINLPDVAEKNRTYTGPSCRILHERTRASCGSSWNCAEDCQKNFGAWMRVCLSKQISSTQYNEVQSRYVEYFRICRVCTEDRKKMIAYRCKTHESTISGFPTKCSSYCSDVFLPYYKECLAATSGDYTQMENQNINAFKHECDQCTAEKLTAVRAVCDTRKKPIEKNFPASCTTQCAAVYPAWYGQCQQGERSAGLLSGSTRFQTSCLVAKDGGKAFRVRLAINFANVEDLGRWKLAFATELVATLGIKNEAGRVVITQVDPYIPTHDELIKGRKGYITVDLNMLVSKDQLEADPTYLVSRMRRLVANPTSSLYSRPVSSHLNSEFGVRTLVWGSHNEDDQKHESSLDIAKAQLQRAMENGGQTSLINVFKALVAYHEAIEKDEEPSVVEVERQTVEYLAAVDNKRPKEMQKAEYAELEYAKAVNNGEKQTDLEVKDTYAQWMRAIATHQAKMRVDELRVVYRLKKAIQNNLPVERTDLLQAVAVLYHDIASKESRNLIRYDRSIVRWKRLILKKKGKESVDAAYSAVEYMKMVVDGFPRNDLLAAESKVEYLMALAKHSPAEMIAFRKKLMEYQYAVKHGEEDAVLKKLANEVFDLHKKAEKLVSKMKKADLVNEIMDHAEVSMNRTDDYNSTVTQTLEDWNYIRNGQNWGGACAEGKYQSPINIDVSSAVKSQMSSSLHYDFAKTDLFTVKNDGNNLYIDAKDGELGSVTVNREDSYVIKRVLFHAKSEHTLNGRRFPLEMQVIGQKEESSGNDDLVGLSVLFQIDDDENEFLDSLSWDNLPSIGGNLTVEDQLDLTKVVSLSNNVRGYGFAYKGSLTTPGCDETVEWHVMRIREKMTSAQYDKIMSVLKFHGNYRTPKPLNGRKVYHNAVPAEFPIETNVWTYEKRGADWPGICETGVAQSPINVNTSIAISTEYLENAYKYTYVPTPSASDLPRLDIANVKGKEMVINGDFGSVSFEDAVWKAKQIKFHTQSEHTVDGKSFPVEMQIVHEKKDTSGNKDLFTTSIFFSIGAESAFLKAAQFASLPNEKDHITEIKGQLDLSSFKSTFEQSQSIVYRGSQTTPTCLETVTWQIFLSPSSLSMDQYHYIHRIFGATGNSRAVQPLNGRELFKNYIPPTHSLFSYDNHGKDWTGTCKNGVAQSPVNLNLTLASDESPFDVNYQPAKSGKWFNDGKSLEMKGKFGSISLRNATFVSQSLRLHHPSEHAINGKRFPAELQIVHQLAGREIDGYLIVSVLFTEGEEDEFLKSVGVDRLPLSRGSSEHVSGAIDLTLLQSSLTKDNYAYRGSFTEPPCNEIVEWHVLKSPQTISPDQLHRLVTALPKTGNARALQDINGRSVFDNGLSDKDLGELGTAPNVEKTTSATSDAEDENKAGAATEPASAIESSS